MDAEAWSKSAGWVSPLIMQDISDPSPLPEGVKQQRSMSPKKGRSLAPVAAINKPAHFYLSNTTIRINWNHYVFEGTALLFVQVASWAVPCLDLHEAPAEDPTRGALNSQVFRLQSHSPSKASFKLSFAKMDRALEGGNLIECALQFGAGL